MFKNLKKRLEQGVNQSPLKGALASASKVRRIMFTKRSLVGGDRKSVSAAGFEGSDCNPEQTMKTTKSLTQENIPVSTLKVIPVLYSRLHMHFCFS